MRTEQLKYFVEVAKCHSIGIAAEKLFVTQPAISIAIKNMEKELGCVLFERSKNGVFLTEIGLKVLEKAEKIIKEEDDIHILVEKDKQSAKEKLQGVLNVGTIPMLTNSFLQNALMDFVNNNPEMHINMKEEVSSDIFGGLLDNKYDIGIVMVSNDEMDKLANNERLHFCKLFSEKTYIVAHKSYNLGNKKSVNFKDIGKLPLACTNISHFGNYFGLSEAETKEMNSKIILATYSLEMIKAFVTSGSAVAILTSSAVEKLKGEHDLDIIPIAHLESGNICYLYNKDNDKPQIIEAFEKSMLKNY